MTVVRPRIVERRVLTDDVYESLKELVMDHRIQPGARITIDGLARELQVSQTPVREALARLEADGLVSREPLRGYRTAPLADARSLEQLFELRLLLEPHAAAAAAHMRTAGQLAAIASAHDDMSGFPPGATYREYRSFTAADERFHDAIATASGNQMLRTMLDRLRSHIHLFRLYSDTGLGKVTTEEHAAIVWALNNEDSKGAERAMIEHLSASRERMMRAASANAGATVANVRDEAPQPEPIGGTS